MKGSRRGLRQARMREPLHKAADQLAITYFGVLIMTVRCYERQNIDGRSAGVFNGFGQLSRLRWRLPILSRYVGS
jgi:hypothetical protein